MRLVLAWAGKILVHFSTCWSLFTTLWCNIALFVLFLLFTRRGSVKLDPLLWFVTAGVHVWTLVPGVASIVIFWRYREDTECSPGGRCVPALVVFLIALVLLVLFALDSVWRWSKACSCEDLPLEDDGSHVEDDAVERGTPRAVGVVVDDRAARREAGSGVGLAGSAGVGAGRAGVGAGRAGVANVGGAGAFAGGATGARVALSERVSSHEQSDRQGRVVSGAWATRDEAVVEGGGLRQLGHTTRLSEELREATQASSSAEHHASRVLREHAVHHVEVSVPWGWGVVWCGVCGVVVWCGVCGVVWCVVCVV